MKNYRNMFKLASIVLGLFGFALMSSSCSKEKDCKCYYTYDGEKEETPTIVTTSDNCEDLKFEDMDGDKLNRDCEE